MRAIRSLGQMADRGRKHAASDARELVVPFGRDAYILRYRVEPDRVIVARVFHLREDRD